MLKLDRIVVIIALLIMACCANAKNRYSSRDTSEKLSFKYQSHLFSGTVEALRKNADPGFLYAETTDFGGGLWRKNNTLMRNDNGGNVIWSVNGDIWEREYSGLDQLVWYYSTTESDSAVIMRAILNCNTGLLINNRTYNVNRIRPRRDNITISGESKAGTILKLTDTDGSDGRTVLLFQDSTDNVIKNVTISNLTLDGNGANQVGKNNAVIKQGGTYGGNGYDTVKNILFSDVIIKNGAGGRSAVWLLTDSLRNDKWTFLACEFDSAYGGHMELRGAFNTTINDCVFRNWALSDSSLYSCIGSVTPVVKNLKVINSSFFNSNGGRFTFELSGITENGLFKDLILDGNGKHANGFSGRCWVFCTWNNVKMLNGGGGHRSGWEIVGGGNQIINSYCHNGSLTISSGRVSSTFIPDQYRSILNKDYLVKNNTFENSLGGNIGIGGLYELNGIKIINNKLYVYSNYSNFTLSQGVKDVVVKDNDMRTGASWNIRFFSGKGNAIDMESEDIVFENNTMRSKFLSGTSPNIFFNMPAAATMNKFRNIRFINNRFSQNFLLYNDSLATTWISEGNRKIQD